MNPDTAPKVEWMERIEEIRTQLEAFSKATEGSFGLQITMRGPGTTEDHVQAEVIGRFFQESPKMVDSLLTEIDRLTTAATLALSCLNDYTLTDTDRTARATAVLSRALNHQ